MLYRLLSFPLITRLVRIAFVFSYSTFFIYAVFFARRRRGLTKRFLNLVPIKSKVRNFLEVRAGGYNELYNYCTNIFGNIVLFIPFTFLLKIIFGVRSTKKVLLLSFLLSASVEIIQYIFRRGVADVDDVLLNILGAWIGCLMFRLISPDVKLPVGFHSTVITKTANHE